MTTRSPYINEIMREWAHRETDFYCSKGPVKKEVREAWIKAHPQKSFALASYITMDKRKIYYVLCTQCADIHKIITIFSPKTHKPGIKFYPHEPCLDYQYKKFEPYEFMDFGLDEKEFEKKVPR